MIGWPRKVLMFPICLLKEFPVVRPQPIFSELVVVSSQLVAISVPSSMI